MAKRHSESPARRGFLRDARDLLLDAYSIPEGLPAFTALTTASTLFVFGLSASMVEMVYGRLTSTSGLTLLFLPFWSGLLGLVGLAVGAVVFGVWRSVSVRRVAADRARPWLVRGFFTLQGIALLSGAGLVLHDEFEATPRVLLDRGKVKVVPASGADATEGRKAVLLWQDDQAWELEWGDRKTTVEVARPSKQAVLVQDAIRGVVLRLADPALEAVSRVEAVPLKSGAGETYLVLAIVGRALGDRALIAVLASDYQEIYRELIERTGCLDEPTVEAVSQDGRDVVLLEAASCATRALTIARGE